MKQLLKKPRPPDAGDTNIQYHFYEKPTLLSSRSFINSVSLNVFSQVNITTELKTDTIRSWSIDKRKQVVYAVCDSMTIDFKYYGRKPRLRKGMAVSIEAVGYKVKRLKIKS